MEQLPDKRLVGETLLFRKAAGDSDIRGVEADRDRLGYRAIERVADPARDRGDFRNVGCVDSIFRQGGQGGDSISLTFRQRPCRYLFQGYGSGGRLS